MNNNYRLRIAPSPTGYPHIGTIYQALFNYAFAKKHDGSFVVRIEDTDRTRFVEDAEAVIFKALDWFGLTEDESPRKKGEFSPYRQSERLDIYHKYAQELIDKGKAYFAYYPRVEAGVKKDYSAVPQESVEPVNVPEAPKSVAKMLKTKDWVLRMKVPQEGVITVKDEIRGEIVFDVKQVTEQILLKSDGFPTYHLAVVVDDHLMQISHIVRAEEWISSLPKHKLLYEYFGWQMPPIYHTATLRNPDKSKLSKRQGHTNVNWFKEEGFLAEAVLNYLGLLGWSHPEGKEIFSLQEFINLFDLKDIRPIAPIFDLTKMKWVNGEYIRKMSIEELEKRLIQFDKRNEDNFAAKVFHQLVIFAQSRMETLKDFTSLAQHFVSGFTPEALKEYTEIAQKLNSELQKIDDWNSEDIMSSLREILLQYKVKMPVLYTIFTGQPKGLPLPESLVILGKEETLKRLAAYV
ncbi:MAG TPA: glutamate--tRNA ligase [Patescibacteria group bacterium]|nr:glutamate--tRNA ligase [Patescibacteria group bacterium]